MNRSFLFEPPTLGVLLTASHMSEDTVYAFNQDAVGLRKHTEDSALLTFVVTTDNQDDIAFFYMSGHRIKLPQKLERQFS